MTEAAAEDLLRLRACPECDYSLETLPAEGVCPECGRAYDQRFLVLRGQGRGQWDGMAGGTWRGKWGHFVWVVIIVWMATRGHRALLNSPNVLAWGVVAIVTLVVGGYARLFSSRDPVMQLWASPAGVAQAASTPEARRAQWVTRSAMWLILPIIVTWSLVQFRAAARVAVPVVGAMVAVTALVGWRVWRRYEAGSGNSSAEGGGFVPALWTWRSIEKVHVGEVANGHARVRCKVTKTFFSGVTHPYWVVDMDVECDEAAAAALRERLDHWWRAGRVTGRVQ